jgi:hypothetical protein
MTMCAASPRAVLRTADRARAETMEAYRTSARPNLWVLAAPLRQVRRNIFAGLTSPDSAAWQAERPAIWRGARFRGARHATIALTALRATGTFQRIDALPTYVEMTVTGAGQVYVAAQAGRPSGLSRREALTKAKVPA